MMLFIIYKAQQDLKRKEKQSKLGTGGLTMASCKGRVCLGRENICKNCIKEDVCKIAEDFYKDPVYGMYIEDCDYFKDCNKFVELPCKVGDIVYQTDGIRIYENKIERIIFDTDNIGFDETSIGKSIFLTREEAEQALKGSDNLER